jgi:anaerobic magnesium-protoporphyrin IX monomethyl ester cyclase
MPRILLGQGYYLRFDRKLLRARQPYAPLGALYAAACLRQAGHDVSLFDSMLAAGESEWEQALERERPEFAVLYEDGFNYLSKMCLLRMREAALTMTRAARARGVRVIAAGPDASDHPEPYLDAGALAVVTGEGEATLVALMEALRSGKAPREVPGLALRTQPGACERTPARPFIKDLDCLPEPAWDLVDVERYRGVWKARHGYFSMNLVSTRGCPYHCNWCAKPIYGQRYAVRSPERVADEMDSLRRRFAPDHFNFVDDIFGLVPGWVERFAAAVLARGARTPFRCLSRADLLSEPVVRALAKAGCATVWIGAESGSQKVLDAMEKGTRVEQIREAARRLQAAGIQVGFFLQFGYPGETRDDVERTLQLVRECRPDDIGVSVSYPLPGTKFHARVAAEMGAKRNWSDSDDLAMLYRGPFPTAFYRSLHRVLHSEFRLRRLREGRAPRRGRLRRLAALAYHAAALPLLRARMEHAARRSHQALGPLPVELPPDAAALPSAQLQ